MKKCKKKLVIEREEIENKIKSNKLLRHTLLKPKYKYQQNINYKIEKLSVKINTSSFLTNIFFLLFINIIFLENIKAIQILKLKVTYGQKLKIIDSKYVPNRVYINGILSTIDSNGRIKVLNEGINNVTLEWDQEKTDYEKMFKNLNSIIEVDFSYFDLSKVKNLLGLFLENRNLIHVNFSNADTSSLTRMSSMFEGCSSLTSIDLSSFITSKVTHMDSMFKYCNSLISLNLSNFQTPKLKKIDEMFYDCTNLKDLDISSFNTRNVGEMEATFLNCISLTSINIRNFNTMNAKNMSQMFKGCILIKEFDLSNMDTSKVINMSSMFEGCRSLISLNLSNFKTPNLQDLESMFNECNSLISINISNFNIVKVKNMKSMFQNCFSLLSLDLSKFDLSNKNLENIFYNCYSLTSINFSYYTYIFNEITYMFFNCASLKSLDLSNFDFSNVKSTEYLFYNCSSLVSLDFSNKNGSSIEKMDYMFDFCESLKSIDFTNFQTLSVISFEGMFSFCRSLTNLDLSSFDTHLVTNMENMFSFCEKLVQLNLSSFDTSSVESMMCMFNGCKSLISLNLSHFQTPNVISMYSMFINCYNLQFLDLSNFTSDILDEIDKMFFNCSSLTYINLYNFDFNGSSTYQMFYKTSDLLILCIEEIPSRLLLDELYEKRCIINDCSSKIIDDRVVIEHNKECINDCLLDKVSKYKYINFCYDRCPLGTHSNNDNKYLCEKNMYDCFEEYPFIIKEENTCTDECSSFEFFNNICTVNSINIESYALLFQNIIKGIEEGLIDDLLDLYLNKGEAITKEENNAIYQILPSSKYIYNSNFSISFVNITQCENFLKENKIILKDEQLFIFKSELHLKELNIPIIDYEVFDLNTKTILDLNYCKDYNIPIIMNIPILINENILFKYYSNSFYYTDICISVNEKEDITLYDRKKNFNNNNLSICPKYCEYIGYNQARKEVDCQCQIKDKIFLSYINNTDELLYKFKIKKKIHNFELFKCYKLLFSKNGLIKNLGSYLTLLVIVLYIISGIYFYKKGFNLICIKINDIINNKTFENIETKEDINSSGNNPSSNKNLANSKNVSSKINFETKYLQDIDFSRKNKKNKDEDSKKNLEIDKSKDYIDYEINIISYKEALENDKRTYFQFYLSLLKEKNMILSILNKNEDYNSQVVKICLIFFSFILNMDINALFFNDDKMHKIYINKGNYNLNINIPRIIYSIIISSISFLIIKRVFLTQNNIFEIKHEKNKYFFKGKVLIVLRCIIIKSVCFFIIGIIVLILFWYYLSSFCAVYKNSQIYLFINTLLSFFISLLIPFFICLLPGIFRIPSLKEPERCLYKISQIIQLI